MASPDAEVVVQIGHDELLAGHLWSHRRRASESATFSYSSEYLARADAYELDPALPLDAGQQQTPVGRATFGAFSDCAPDRWGRRLISRAEAKRAKRERTTERSFGEIDYLLGVRDDLRQGALRFRDPETGEYFSAEHQGVPHLLGLAKLLSAAEAMERDEANEEELATLLRGGSSLGGARPKAHVLDNDGRLAIAKFPSPANDDWDVMRWEAVALELARQAGVNVPGFKLHEIDGKAVLIVDRFDRVQQQRVGYVSAMTMLEAVDGDRSSYLEIADVVERHSPDATIDLGQLWRRVAFSIVISNTDDHLRNHGFLRTTSAGWSLSPAFDLNPDPRPGPKRLSTAIDFDRHDARIDVLMGVAAEFRLSPAAAEEILGQVGEATGRWRVVAGGMGLDSAAIEQMEAAFEHEQASLVAELVASPTTRP